jgi:hypothetical protein
MRPPARPPWRHRDDDPRRCRRSDHPRTAVGSNVS